MARTISCRLGRSMLFDADLDFSNDYERVRAHRPIAERYPVGTALFSLPFLLVAHLLLLVGKTLGLVVNADGFGYSYETAFGLAGYFFGVLGLLAVLRITSQYVSVGIATLSLLTVWMSSFLVWYMVVEPSMPHSMAEGIVRLDELFLTPLLLVVQTALEDKSRMDRARVSCRGGSARSLAERGPPPPTLPG